MTTLPQVISEAVLRQVSERIECRTGLHFPVARFADLERGLAAAAREVGCPDVCAYAESLLQRHLHAADIDTLAGNLTIGETHFFRDPLAFGFLETVLLPELIAARRGGERRLRLWSAGCASGEEPYSLAMLLHRLLPDLSEWSISILGTDINPKALARAATGVYTDWSFRDAPEWVKPRYFSTHAGQRHEIQPWLKRMVRFACLNLVDDAYPSMVSSTHAMDLIVCRNVLLYFAPTRTTHVVERFHRALVDDGHLMIGAVEASQMTFPGFVPIPAPSVALHRKQSAAAGRQVPAVSTDPLPVSSDPSPVTHVSPPRLTAHGSPVTGLGQRTAAQRARACADLGESAEALMWCDRALSAAKADPTLHFLRAGVLQELQRDVEALQALRSVLFLDPGHVLAQVAMANLERRQGRLPAATRHLGNARQSLLGREESEELPDSGGLTVGHLSELLSATEDLWKLTDASGAERGA